MRTARKLAQVLEDVSLTLLQRVAELSPTVRKAILDRARERQKPEA